MNGKRKILILMTLIFMVLLGGCQMGDKFSNQDEAREYLLADMEEKYGMTYEVTGRETYKNYPLYGDVYTCVVSPVGEPDREVYARVTQSGSVSDNGATYLFAEGAEQIAQEVCESKDYVISYEVSLKAPITTHIWKKEDGLDNYIIKSGAYDQIRITLEEGKSDEEYVELITDFLDELYQIDINSELRVYAGEKDILLLTVKVLGENKTEPYTEDEIRDNMEIMAIEPIIKDENSESNKETQ